ncbi:hypothetical protein [Halosegnis sp.]|uniref:hypothetical protein n=1 Tax=Halosegnis sp. TaxID=2864959 RepID=UPI0035D44CAF
MSVNDDGDDGPGTREVAHRLFAAEFDDADFSYSESDEERAPNYVITPSGARVNRLFLVGVLTEKEWVNEDMVRARVVDPTGPFVVYAGQYQPDELAFLERTEPPAFLAVTGKARTFQPDDSDRVFTSVRPESVSKVDADTRDRWAVEAAKQTIDRVETAAAAIETNQSGDALVDHLLADGVDPALASGIALALDHYGTTPTYLSALRDLAEATLEMVAGERDEVGGFDVAPDEGDGPAAAALAGEPAMTETETETDSEVPSGAEFDPVSEETSTDRTTGSAGTRTAESSDDGPTREGSVTEEPAEEPSTEAPIAGESTADEPPADSDIDEPETADESVGEFEADELGDFETDAEPTEPEFDPEEEVLSENEREQIESEFGTEFTTGDEVEPEPELEPEATERESSADSNPPSEESSAAESASEQPIREEPEGNVEPEPESEPSSDEPLDETVMAVMEELDEGDGADREALTAAVVDRTGADADAVAEAIEDALMSGRCYEPDEGVLKPI